MTAEANKPIEEVLLDLHLDRIDPADRASLENRLATEEEIAAKSDALRRILQPLDSLTASAPPGNLPDKIIRRVAGSRPEAGSCAPVEFDETGSSRGWRFVPRDLIAVAACLVILFCLIVPAVSRVRAHAQRTVCADNLSSIYRAVTAYGQAFAGGLPNAGAIPGGCWLYSGPTGTPRASNSRHPYLLAKLGFVTDPADFVCPSSPNVPVEVDDFGDLDDFASAANCTYDSLNMAGPTPTLSDAGSAVYMSDPNPLFVDGFYHGSVNPNDTNSPIHGGKGQNVLLLDGRVRWMTSPFRNRRDNVWVAGDLHTYTGTETQQDEDDAFLVPATPGVWRRFPTGE